jgi:hypothetical protein
VLLEALALQGERSIVRCRLLAECVVIEGRRLVAQLAERLLASPRLLRLARGKVGLHPLVQRLGGGSSRRCRSPPLRRLRLEHPLHLKPIRALALALVAELVDLALPRRVELGLAAHAIGGHQLELEPQLLVALGLRCGERAQPHALFRSVLQKPLLGR